jgi:hypothetical protein
MTAPLRRYAAKSDEVEHLDSELSESIAKIRTDIEVSSGRPAGERATGTGCVARVSNLASSLGGGERDRERERTLSGTIREREREG